MLINLIGKTRMIGFKFVLPSSYPQMPPLTFLDEPEDELVIEMIDYIDKGNVIEFSYLQEWRNFYTQAPQNFHLQALLIRINNLYT